MNNTQQAAEDYVPYGEEWEQLMLLHPKKFLVGIIRNVGQRKQELEEIVQASKQAPTPAPDAVEAKAKAKKLYPDFKDEYGYPTHIKNMNGDVKKLRKAYLAGHAEGQKATVEAKSAGVWVKASERIVDRPVTWRFTDKSSAGHGNLKSHIMIGLHRVADYDKSVVEWLDETATSHAEGEKGAVGFAEWIGKERWMFGSSLWFKNTDEATYVKTTLELYNLYLTC